MLKLLSRRAAAFGPCCLNFVGRTLAVIVSVGLLLGLSACSIAGGSKVPAYTVDFDVPYLPGGNAGHLADLYVPQGAGPFPAVMVIHGGGWARGERADMEKFSQRLVKAGYVVMNLTYRLAPEFRFPAQTDDVAAGQQWLIENAARWKIDPNRIGAYGYSAGAHLALMLALMPDNSGYPLKAAVSGAGPTDMSVYLDSLYLKKLIGGTLAEFPQAYVDASPISYVSADDPPIFMYHGTWDKLVEVEQSRKLAAALAAQGLTYELIEEPGKGHVTNFLFDGDSYARAEAFLDQHVKFGTPQKGVNKSPEG